jgi:hypothetical protein
MIDADRRHGSGDKSQKNSSEKCFESVNGFRKTLADEQRTLRAPRLTWT